MSFPEWWSNFRRTGDICPVRLGCLRSELHQLWGEPDDVSTMRKGGEPLILKYGGVEFHFEPGADGGLRLIFKESANGVCELSIGGTLYDPR